MEDLCALATSAPYMEVEEGVVAEVARWWVWEKEDGVKVWVGEDGEGCYWDCGGGGFCYWW